MSNFKNSKTIGHVDSIEDIYNPKTKKDTQATRFAMELLMPTKAFEFEWQRTNGNIKKISEIFRVETEVCTMRAIELKLLGSFIK